MFGVPSNFLGQATHTSGLFSGCSDMRHVPGISSVFFTAPRMTLWGLHCAHSQRHRGLPRR